MQFIFLGAGMVCAVLAGLVVSVVHSSQHSRVSGHLEVRSVVLVPASAALLSNVMLWFGVGSACTPLENWTCHHLGYRSYHVMVLHMCVDRYNKTRGRK